MNLNELLPVLINDPVLHAKWLNTLSFLENTGARKISAGEDPETVSYTMLKHAAEEHRHAFYLKKQLGKAGAGQLPTYAAGYLLAPACSKHYLNRLDLQVCRYLKTGLGLRGATLGYAAYLLVTYAIEVRASELYPLYQRALENADSRINVKSIIMEEEGHLEEMTAGLRVFRPDWQVHAEKAMALEAVLFREWIKGIGMEAANGPL